MSVTISQALIEAEKWLSQRAKEAARLNAEVLLAHVLGVNRTYLIANFNESLSDANVSKYRSLLAQHHRGWPLQYITGHQEFWGLDFMVTPDVLIPRPETEILVEQTLSLIRDTNATIVDVGTGSGCVAVALAVELNRVKIFASDISEKAIAIARENAKRHHVSDRIQFLVGDLLEPLASWRGDIDVIVCNPPYVSKDEFSTLPQEIRDFEPRPALTDEADGLVFYRRLSRDAFDYLKNGGYVILEMAYGRCDDVLGLFSKRFWKIVRIVNDLQNIPRCLVAQKKPLSRRHAAEEKQNP